MSSPTLSGTSWTQGKVMAVLSCLFQMLVIWNWNRLSGSCMYCPGGEVFYTAVPTTPDKHLTVPSTPDVFHTAVPQTQLLPPTETDPSAELDKREKQKVFQEKFQAIRRVLPDILHTPKVHCVTDHLSEYMVNLKKNKNYGSVLHQETLLRSIRLFNYERLGNF